MGFQVVRPEPGAVSTEDGYRYQWDTAGQAVAVLPQHVWLFDGHPLYEVAEVEDAPLILPVLVNVDHLPVTVVPPEVVETVEDLSHVKVKPAVLPKPKPRPSTVVPPEVVEGPSDLSHVEVEPPDLPEPTPLPDTAHRDRVEEPVQDLTGVPVQEPRVPVSPSQTVTVVPPDPPVDVPAVVVVSDLWSDQDRARFEGG